MSNFRYRYHGDVVVAIHTQGQPSPKVWSAYLRKLKERPPRAAIVWWDHWTPDLNTRKEILKNAPSQIPVAVISDDPSAKYAVEALNLFLAKFRYFSPCELDAAFAYVGLTVFGCSRLIQTLRWPVTLDLAQQ